MEKTIADFSFVDFRDSAVYFLTPNGEGLSNMRVRALSEGEEFSFNRNACWIFGSGTFITFALPLGEGVIENDVIKHNNGFYSWEEVKASLPRGGGILISDGGMEFSLYIREEDLAEADPHRYEDLPRRVEEEKRKREKEKRRQYAEDVSGILQKKYGLTEFRVKHLFTASGVSLACPAAVWESLIEDKDVLTLHKELYAPYGRERKIRALEKADVPSPEGDGYWPRGSKRLDAMIRGVLALRGVNYAEIPWELDPEASDWRKYAACGTSSKKTFADLVISS